MTHASNSFAPTLRPHRIGARLLPRWLLVAGTVALIGLCIDLFRGPPASALQLSAAPISSLAAPPMDHAVVGPTIDEQPLEPGASIAAYGAPSSEAPGHAAEAAALPAVADDTLEPGASIAAYER